MPVITKRETPLVSVVMPTRGRVDVIRIAIQSVLAQSHPHWEIIVVNDGGESVSGVVAEHDRSGRIAHVSLPRSRGAAAARNVALRIARGKYIAYLDDDDWFEREHLATLVEALEAGGHAVAYSDSRRVIETLQGDRHRPAAVEEPYHATPFCRDGLLVNNYIPILSVMHRRDLLDDIGMFDETLEVLEDWELWIRMSRSYDFVRVPRVTASVRWREDGQTTTIAHRRDHYPCARRIHARYPSADAAIVKARAQLLSALEPSFRNTAPACSIIVSADHPALSTVAAATRALSVEFVVVGDVNAEHAAVFEARGHLVRSVAANPDRALTAAVDACTGHRVALVPDGATPTHGWLRELVAEAHDDAGAVASNAFEGGGVAPALMKRAHARRVVEGHATLADALRHLVESVDELRVAARSMVLRSVERPVETSGAGVTLVAAAREAMVARDYDRAATLVAELEARHPHAEETRLVRGVLALSTDEPETALAAFVAAQALGVPDHRASLGVAMSLTSLGRTDEAWDTLMGVMRRDPDASNVVHMLFRVGVQLERWAELVGPLTRYLAIVPQDNAIRFALASVCVRAGELSRAREHCRALSARDPQFDGLRELTQRVDAQHTALSA